MAAAYEKFTVHDVPADGNCLFSSLAMGLGHHHTAASVRSDIVEYIEDHLDEVLSQFSNKL